MSSNETDSTMSHPLGIVLPLTAFYIVVFCFAVSGNILILVAIWRKSNMRTVVNLFLANLACSDLIFITLSMFDVVSYLLNGWFAGATFCKLQCFVIETSYTCSVLTLVAVSLERYFSICHPHMKRRTKKANVVAVGFNWLLSALFCAVLLYAYTTRTNEKGYTVCENDVWTKSSRKVFYTVHSIVVYLFPLTVMFWAHWKISQVVSIPRTSTGLPDRNKNSECSESSDGGKRIKLSLKSPNSNSDEKKAMRSSKSRSKSVSKMHGRRRVIRILIVVTVSFMAIWTPFIVIRMLLYYGLDINSFVWRSSQLLVLSSTAVNSIIYAFMSPQFRKSFVELVPWLACILQRKQKGSRSYTSSICQSPRFSESQENSSSNTRDRLSSR